MTPTWTILIATLGQRTASFARLMAALMPQVDNAGGQVTVEALFNHGERLLCEVRDDLLAHATAEYTCFVDDDDEVPSYYVRQVLPLLDGVDYIGWRMQCYVDGVPLKPTRHSLTYPGWGEDPWCYYRDVTHLNPIRRALAVQASFCGEWPEDGHWRNQMVASGLVRTEHVVEAFMYSYHSSTEDSTGGAAWATGVQPVPPGGWPAPVAVDSPWFSWHPASTHLLAGAA